MNVKVGYVFIRVSEDVIRNCGIKLEKCPYKVSFNDKKENLYKGKTFQDSLKVDGLIDSNLYEVYPIKE